MRSFWTLHHFLVESTTPLFSSQTLIPNPSLKPSLFLPLPFRLKMSTATTPISKALSMAADSCLLSLPSLFTTKTQCPYPSLPSKPVKLQLSCCHSSLFLSSLFLKKRTHFPSVVSLVSQTSDWAQQGEDNTLTIEQENLEMPTLKNQESPEFEARVLDWDAEGEDATIEASEDEGGSGEEEVPFVEPPEEAKLFVGNLPYDVDSQKLAMLLEQAGTVEISEVIYNRDTDQSRGFGFVTMSTVEEAEKAVEMFDRYDLDGRLLTVNKAAPRGAKPEQAPRISEPAFRIYVGNLPWDVDNARLEQVFSRHGKVVDARVVYDRETGRSRGFGFVTMSTRTEVDDAIAALDGQTLEGRAIRVNVAEERSRRRSF